MSAKRLVTVVLEVWPDDEGDTPIEQAVKDALKSAVLRSDERIVSYKERDAFSDEVRS